MNPPGVLMHSAGAGPSMKQLWVPSIHSSISAENVLNHVCSALL